MEWGELTMSDVFFGIQLAVVSPPRDPWRQRLTNIVQRHLHDLRVPDKRGLYGAAVNLLREALPRVSLAYWDFVPNGKGEFTEWTEGIEDDAKTTWVADAGAPNDLALATLLFLMPAGGASAELCGERCDLPEADWQTGATYEHLLETVTMLPWSTVRADGIYVTPGGLDLAFSFRELLTPDYGYLLPLG